MTQKKTLGRQKIEIKKIEKKCSLQVTFTKRRNGLFKKASELCILAGAEIAILVQSPGNHMYSFGYPSIESVIDTFLGNNVSNSSPLSVNPACMHAEYNKMYLEIDKELEAEKGKSNNVEGSGDQYWWENSFVDLEIDELEHYIESMKELKNNLTKKADELRNSVASTSDTNTDGNVDGLNTNASNVDGLPDDQLILPNSDDQVMLPNLDEFLPYNVGVTDEDLMRLQAFHNSVEFSSSYGFGNGEFVLDNQGDTNNQVSSDFGTIVVPNQNYFGQGQI